jgi:hypothetical protein
VGTRNSSWIATGEKLAQIIEQIRDMDEEHICQAARDARAPDQKCLINARRREKTTWSHSREILAMRQGNRFNKQIKTRTVSYAEMSSADVLMSFCRSYPRGWAKTAIEAMTKITGTITRQ